MENKGKSKMSKSALQGWWEGLAESCRVSWGGAVQIRWREEASQGQTKRICLLCVSDQSTELFTWYHGIPTNWLQGTCFGYIRCEMLAKYPNRGGSWVLVSCGDQAGGRDLGVPSDVG